AQERVGGLDAVEGAAQVDRQDVVPVVGDEIGELRDLPYAGVVHQRGDLRERQGSEGRFDLPPVAHVGLVGVPLAYRFLDGGDRLRRPSAVAVNRCHGRPFGGQGQRGGAADAAPCPGHHG